MPVYEYECPKHGRYEVTQRISEPALTSCTVEDCKEPVRKLISATSFSLKGGGWYSDGYGSNGKKSASETKSEPKAEPTSESKTEPKSAGSTGGCGAPGCGGGTCAAKA